MALDEKKRRTLELANRLQDMTNAEWAMVKNLVDARFHEKANQAALEMQLCEVKEEDFLY